MFKQTKPHVPGLVEVFIVLEENIFVVLQLCVEHVAYDAHAGYAKYEVLLREHVAAVCMCACVHVCMCVR